MRNSKSAYLFTYNNLEISLISIINAVSITIRTNTHKQQQSSFNNTSPSVSVASRPLFVRVRHYATQLTAASRPYPPRKFTLFECGPATPHQFSGCSLARPHQLKVLRREFILTTCPQCVQFIGIKIIQLSINCLISNR